MALNGHIEDVVTTIQDRFFLALLIAASLAFAWVLAPFAGAVLWAIVIAILFFPLNDRFLRRIPSRPNSAALATLLVIIAMVIIPAILLGIALLQEASSVYDMIQSGQLDLNRYFMQMQNALPHWATSLLDRFGVGNFEAARAKIATGAANSFQAVATQALNIGQSLFGFLVALGIMLYLTFFLLRDGRKLTRKLESAIPLVPAQRTALFDKIIAVVQATIKGSLIVAIIQGLIGGVVFWGLGIHAPLLWGVSMAFLSLLPAIGTGLIWVPVAIYLLATGAVVKGLILVFCGIFVIGMVDNVLRPILVGRDTRLPDYVVLITTLGGLEVFGFSGFLIGPVIAALFLAVWEIFGESQAHARLPAEENISPR